MANLTIRGITRELTSIPADAHLEGEDSTGSFKVPIWDTAALATLTDGATITPDFATFIHATVTLGGNRTLANPTNVKPGQSGIIEIKQDGTGSRTLAFGTNWKFAGGTAPVLSTAAGARDVISYVALSSTVIYATLAKDVK